MGIAAAFFTGVVAVLVVPPTYQNGKELLFRWQHRGSIGIGVGTTQVYVRGKEGVVIVPVYNRGSLPAEVRVLPGPGADVRAEPVMLKGWQHAEIPIRVRRTGAESEGTFSVRLVPQVGDGGNPETGGRATFGLGVAIKVSYID